MRKSFKLILLWTVLTTISLLLAALDVAAQGTTAFTWQGRLVDGSGPATGRYDIQLVLFDAASGGIALGTNTLVGVTVANGVFTATPDFGSAVFDGGSRWLQLSVRTNSSASWTLLTPREALTPVPYALSASFVQAGRNFGFCNSSGSAAAWSADTRTWSIISLGGTSGTLMGSGGNIAFQNTGGSVAAWDHVTGTWTQTNLGATNSTIVGSVGNFAFMNPGGVASAWDSATRAWTQVNLGGTSGQVIGSGGNFGFMNNTGTAAAWDHVTRTWTQVTLVGSSGSIVGSGGNFAFMNTSGIASAWDSATRTWTRVNIGGSSQLITGSE